MPVYHNEAQGFWALSRYADVTASIKDSETSSSAHGVTLDMVLNPERALPSGRMIIMMDPPEHTRMRRLVNKELTPRAVAGLEAMAKSIIDAHAARVDPAAFDAVADFSDLFPFDVITTMLGVPEQYRDQIRVWLAKPLERGRGDTAFSAEAVDGVRAPRRCTWNSSRSGRPSRRTT